jgi:hypothetical protein
MISAETIQPILTAAVAAAVHALFLSFAVKLMVEIQIRYGHACGIVGVQYVTAGLCAGGLVLGGIEDPRWLTVMAAAMLVCVGAVLIGSTLRFASGERLGVGNGVLIQFMQIPLILPFVILASFFWDASI